MAKEQKIKKRKVILVVVMLAIVLAISLGIFYTVKYFKNKGNVDTKELESNNAIELPDTTYNNMKVTDVEMEFLKENNETMVSMVIENTSKNKIENEKVDAMLLDKDGKTLGKTETFVSVLEPMQEYRISVILKGDLTATTTIKLQKVK